MRVCGHVQPWTCTVHAKAAHTEEWSGVWYLVRLGQQLVVSPCSSAEKVQQEALRIARHQTTNMPAAGGWGTRGWDTGGRGMGGWSKRKQERLMTLLMPCVTVREHDKAF